MSFTQLNNLNVIPDTCQELDQCKPGDHRWVLEINEGTADVSCRTCGCPLTDEPDDLYAGKISVIPTYVRECQCRYPCDHGGWWEITTETRTAES